MTEPNDDIPDVLAMVDALDAAYRAVDIWPPGEPRPAPRGKPPWECRWEAT